MTPTFPMATALAALLHAQRVLDQDGIDPDEDWPQSEIDAAEGLLIVIHQMAGEWPDPREQ